MSTTDRINAYLATGRNSDLPELVRRWIGDGEGVGQDEIVGIVAEERDCRAGCDTCERVHVTHRFHIDLAESETCNAITAKVFACPECAREWEAASDAIERREK